MSHHEDDEPRIKFSHHTYITKGLTPSEYPHRVRFCKEIIEKCKVNGFYEKIIWQSIASFEPSVMYTQDSDYAVEYTPLIDSDLKVNVWVGIMGNKILGPYEIEDVTSETYLEFLKNLPNLLNNAMDDIWLQLEDVSYINQKVKKYLNEVYAERLIGSSGAIKWPKNSSDLNPVHTLIWGTVQHEVYKDECRSKEEILERIREGIESVRGMVESSLIDIKQYHLSRCKACIQANGMDYKYLL